ncbi:fumarylacetoacetate hydrolase family protein [Sphingomonas colocasiae]|uniref:Fumarylacetoacetate hydrolase family protein n=1 Tax=Sphingomonas colocasiae TaxID=1848973 RepID=A0ABS7PKZ7_9SPHN|nr:fumarylacetoacetate hydrolase family protein [Sphingomonas colocasiae]MBY8821967.1 fumarylacetoacetate hydrolase family protein [Sphingomonas colocasiae]
MKLVSYVADGAVRPGALRDDGRIVDLGGLAPSVLALIAGDALDRVRALVSDPATRLAPSAAPIVAPIPEPRRNIFCVGKNYREHALEFGGSGFDGGAKGGDEIPEAPIIFTKATTSVVGPFAPVLGWLDPDGQVDYEGELAVVIGRGGRAIAAHDAMSHVFGYTIVNDITARGAQKRHKQWLLGKGLDTFCPMGPTLVTADEIGDPAGLRVITHVNGELRQDAPVSDLIFDIPALIAAISQGISLLPGDVIATGTPAGVGIGFSPPRFLAANDIVSVRIDPIGTLENPIH